MESVPVLNLDLLGLAARDVQAMRDVARRRLESDLAKAAVVAPPAAGGDPMAGGAMPPGGDPMAGGGAPAPPPGGDPMAGAGGPPPIDPAMQAAAMQAVQQAQAGGGGAGPGVKGKSPKDQIQQGQMKIVIYMLSEICKSLNIKLPPELLVPMTDPSTDQTAMQETMGASMVPSTDPMAGAAPPPADPAAAAPAAGGAGAFPSKMAEVEDFGTVYRSAARLADSSPSAVQRLTMQAAALGRLADSVRSSR